MKHPKMEISKSGSVKVLVIMALTWYTSTGIFATAVAGSNSVSCNSRVYCKSAGVSYMSHSKLSGMYLNVTAIATARTTSIPKCQALCLKTDGCYSLNINISLSNNYECQLLTQDIYASASLLVKNKDFIHLFIKGSCEKHTCKNDGICIQQYFNDIYSCKCKVNATFYSWGKNCENVKKGAESAFYFWSFNELGPSRSLVTSGTYPSSSHYFTLASSDKVLQVPGRQKSVLYCQSTEKGFCLSMCSDASCINTYRGCENGATYSVWVKFTRVEINKARKGYIMMNTGLASGYTGVEFYARENREDGYRFVVADFTKKWVLEFGKNILALQWTHFAVVYEKTAGLCAYINGKLDKCGGAMTLKTAEHSNRCLRIGRFLQDTHACEVYLDDFAVWKSPLTPEDISEVYKLGKA